MRRDRGSLYFLQVMPFGPVKIGWTSGCVTARMKALQQASPYELKWLGAAILPQTAETEAHRLLSAHRVRSEWFHPTPEVMAFAERIIGDFDASAYIELHFRPSLQARIRQITAYRRDRRIDRIFAAAGLDRWVGHKWMERQRLLPRETMDAMEREANRIEQEAA